jgi:phenylalanyl-tRNA synthetase alpha chain
MAAIKDVPGPEKKEFGQAANAFRNEVQTAVDARKEILSAQAEAAKSASFDYTLPGSWPSLGSKHPITQIIERATGIFRSMGFSVADGPDIETPFNNFDALNVPPEHPSRADKDTFYLDEKTPHESLLRTHTSPVQIRVMQSRTPPLRIIAPGRCYRRDTTDATHSANFHQIEGLYVDRKVSLADLKGDITHFAKQLMGADVHRTQRRIRFLLPRLRRQGLPRLQTQRLD